MIRYFKKMSSWLLAGLILIFGTSFSIPVYSQGKVVLRCSYWGDIKEIAIIKNTAKKFEEKYPGIKVKLERYPSGDPYNDKLLTLFAGGMPPDVMFVSVEQLMLFAGKNVLLPLNGYIDKHDYNTGKYFKKIMDRFTVKGKVYALPRDVAPVCIVYYNKKIFNEAGMKYPDNNWNWNDFLETAKKLTKYDKNGVIVQFGFADDWDMWDLFILDNGGSIVDNVENPTKCTLDSMAAIEAIQFRKDLIYKYRVMPSPSNSSRAGGLGASDLFMNGKVALFSSGIWKTPSFRDIKAFGWDVVMFPKNNSGKRGFPMSGSGYGVVSKTKHPEEAWKLVTYLAGEEGQIELAKTGLAEPAIKSIAGSKYFLNDDPPKGKSFLVDMIDYGTFWPKMSNWSEALNSYVNPELDKIWMDKKDAKDVLPGIAKEVNSHIFNIK